MIPAVLAASLKPRYRELLPGGGFQLSNGMHISIEDLQKTLKVYTGSQLKPSEVKVQKSRSKSDSLDVYLGRLFSPKQKELVLCAEARAVCGNTDYLVLCAKQQTSSCCVQKEKKRVLHVQKRQKLVLF